MAAAAHRPAEGHGRRLTAAFEALEAFPALAVSRDRVLTVVTDARASEADLVEAVESDVALAVAVLRVAGRSPGGSRAPASIPAAVSALGVDGVEALARETAVYDFFERTPVWDVIPDHFRLHAVATQRAADRLGRELRIADRDELVAAALLHDIGKLVLIHAYDGYPARIVGDARTPEERVRAERGVLGVDHGVVGGVLARRWGLPDRLARAIERHHSDEACDEALLVRLADMLAHYAADDDVEPARMLEVSRRVGLDPETLRAVMCDLPFGPPRVARTPSEPCPLSPREHDILCRLAEGKVYKQIGLELGISASTVRTHLHNVYAKIGAVDRAQAVLRATERGWI